MNETSNFAEKAHEAQKIFFDLPEDFKNQLIERAHEEANKIRELIASGKAKNYTEALSLLPSIFPEYPKMVVKLGTIEHGEIIIKAEENGDYYLHIGESEPLFLGNADEGVYSELSGILHIDTERQDKNLSNIYEKLNVLKKSGGNA